jgi:hypothetical protein
MASALEGYIPMFHTRIFFSGGVRSIRRLGGGGTGFQGHFWILKRAPKKFFPEMLEFSRHTMPKLHVFDQIYLKNIEISKEKVHF